MSQQRSISTILDEIAHEALHSGDQKILDLVEEASEMLGFDDLASSAVQCMIGVESVVYGSRIRIGYSNGDAEYIVRGKCASPVGDNFIDLLLSRVEGDGADLRLTFARGSNILLISSS